jgi:DNA repair protein RadC
LPKKEKITKPYEGHRDRLKQRFRNSGFQGFQDYEVLELLLTYALPRVDTKPIARELLARFKSFNGVLNADLKDLQEINGIKEHSAVFIKAMNKTVSYYLDQKAKSHEIQFTKILELVEYLRGTIGGNRNEVMRVLYLNSENKLIEAEDLGEGTVKEAVAFPRRIVEGALKHHATTVIVAHNHPGGLAEPSESDISVTRQINDALLTVDILLQEHVIITDNNHFSFRQQGLLK